MTYEQQSGMNYRTRSIQDAERPESIDDLLPDPWKLPLFAISISTGTIGLVCATQIKEYAAGTSRLDSQLKYPPTLGGIGLTLSITLTSAYTMLHFWRERRRTRSPPAKE